MDYKRFIESFNKSDNFSVNNRMKLVALELGYAEVEMEVDESLYNCMGSLHGGAMATLADVAGGTAIASHGVMCVTLNANINYIRPVTGGKVTAIAKVQHIGKQTGISEVKLINEGKTICMGTYTMFIRG